MKWALPLTALSEIRNFSSSNIPSENHYQYSADTSSVVWPWRSFKTSPHTPPNMTVAHHGGQLSDGYVFLTPSDSKNEDGTYEMSGTGFIFTPEGDLVFAGEETGMGFCDEWIAGMTDFRPQDYNGRPYLTYWNGCNTKGAHWGHRWGRVTFINDDYTNFTINPHLNINTLDSATRGQIDVHEHQMTEDNTMVVTSYNNTQFDLSSMKGSSESWVADSMFFEIDIKTQEVLFEWRATDHISFNASRFGFKAAGAGTTERIPWDWFHINSVQKIGGNYLISARHHWALYFISGRDGSVIWKLDGIDGGTFGKMPQRFRWQHHARAHNVSEAGMTVSLFNNHVNGAKNEKTQTRAVAYWLPMPASKDVSPVLVKNLRTPDELVFSGTQGSYQMDVGNGNGFVGYGKIPLAREYGPADDGSDLRWEGRFGRDGAVMSYRAFKAAWHGTPKNWDPVVLFEEVRDATPKVYVSWNGATDIESWAVFAGNGSNTLRSIGVAKKTGFETVFDLKKESCVQVGAVRDGEIIRASNIACIDLSKAGSNTNMNGGNDELELQAQKAHLKAQMEVLKKQIEELESGTWDSYHIFAEVASAVALIVAVTWAYIVWRDWRRRSQYQDDYDDESSSGRSGSRISLPMFGRFRRKNRPGPEVMVEGAGEFDERKLGRAEDEKGVYVETLNIDEEEEEEKGEDMGIVNVRTPFIRQATAG